MNADLIFADESYAIRGAVFEVYKTLFEHFSPGNRCRMNYQWIDRARNVLKSIKRG